jgi:hypothetical protein
MRKKVADLFTVEEHVVFAAWLKVAPKCDVTGALPDVDTALEQLGFTGKAGGYTESDAAVAAIVLERIQERLPQWASFREIKDGNTVKEVVTLGRNVKERRAKRKIETAPRHLLTINWADSGPGFSWPVAYYVTWVPIYDVFVVTASADSPDAFGYCDFAIGHFPNTKEFVAEAAQRIKADWTWQHSSWDQQRWAYLFDTGLIDGETADRLAKEVWGEDAG